MGYDFGTQRLAQRVETATPTAPGGGKPRWLWRSRRWRPLATAQARTDVPRGWRASNDRRANPRRQDRAVSGKLSERHGLSLDWLLTGEGSMLRESAAAEAEAGTVETAARPDDAAQIAEVEPHWRVALATGAEDADFDRRLNFLEWLLDWWEAVGPEDRAWLNGQLRRHIPDDAASQLPRPSG